MCFLIAWGGVTPPTPLGWATDWFGAESPPYRETLAANDRYCGKSIPPHQLGFLLSAMCFYVGVVCGRFKEKSFIAQQILKLHCYLGGAGEGFEPSEQILCQTQGIIPSQCKKKLHFHTFIKIRKMNSALGKVNWVVGLQGKVRELAPPVQLFCSFPHIILLLLEDNLFVQQ